MRLAAIRDQWRRVIAKNPNRSNRINRIGYQIRKPVSIFRENRKPNAKQRKSANRNEHQSRKTDLKISQNRKTENPDAPLNDNYDFSFDLTSGRSG